MGCMGSNRFRSATNYPSSRDDPFVDFPLFEYISSFIQFAQIMHATYYAAAKMANKIIHGRGKGSMRELGKNLESIVEEESVLYDVVK